MDLVNDTDLIAASNQALAARRSMPSYQKWTENLSTHLGKVQAATEHDFRTEAFQRELWESEAISATGQGFVPTKTFWTDQTIIGILWEARTLEAADASQGITNELQRLWDAAADRIRQLESRVPRLKLTRVFAALQPKHFTSLADFDALVRLAKALGIGKARDGLAVLHQRVLDRLDGIWSEIQVPSDEPPELTRLKLPWLLLKGSDKQAVEGITVEAGDTPGQIQLRPLPASRRRRGMLAIGGAVASILAMLQFVKDGCSREDFREHVRSVNPKLAPSSVNTNINALIAEWGVLAAEGDQLVLTSRGAAFLESEDPDDVSDWLLTQILGFDNLLSLLRQGPREHKTLIADLRQVNPGWTTNFAPTALISWLRAIGLTDFTSGKSMSLTPRGQEWASRIYWEPGRLEGSPVSPPPATSQSAEAIPVVFERPNVDQLLANFPKDLVFSRKMVAQLDAALWSHDRRHFVILTGLSGAGKTQLARSYATALWSKASPSESGGVYVLPVQPGWHDPTALLGYVNPLNTDRYVRTGFLNFVLDAVRDPDRPYTVILDEMNLSHPEQYFAPLLSAMETGGQIELHAQDDDVDEIPTNISYPSNLLIIGTVNMDETTHGLSDKVLDRAAVIEFWDIDTESYPAWETSGLDATHVAQLRLLMKQLGSALSPARLHFGWRTIGDVIGYVRAALAGGAIEFLEAVDQAIYAKVLPKIRGEDGDRLRKALTDTAKLLGEAKCIVSEHKVTQLSDDLARLGSVRFWR
ncbi:hypothetical protein LGM43_13885 [Burkholderia seminalis]|uniref:McrB family protein n=1 Tax=Burkholderia seminalis TaxID=488731 RepID=UPI001CF54D47|nr:hypothetical protein [Burkholderia seminalis]MCA7951359.1 hypothetical protein [Burkholderia seminalis]